MAMGWIDDDGDEVDDDDGGGDTEHFFEMAKLNTNMRKGKAKMISSQSQ
jgi:hypothetical protein